MKINIGVKNSASDGITFMPRIFGALKHKAIPAKVDHKENVQKMMESERLNSLVGVRRSPVSHRTEKAAIAIAADSPNRFVVAKSCDS